MSEPIRIIHTADLHIGTQNYGRFDPSTGLHTRLIDFLKSLDKLVDYAIEKDADIVLICGDIFKSREPDVTQQREFAKRVKRLSLADIAVYIVVGNHDLHNAAGKATSVEIYETLALSKVYVRRIPTIDKIKTKRGEVSIVAIPYVSSANISVDGTTIEEIAVEMRRRLDLIVTQLTAKLDKNLPSVLASHYSIIGANAGSESGIMLGREVTLPLSVFQRQEYEYVALGHIHKYQVLSEYPPVAYSGSLDRVDFGEENQDKGLIDVNISKGKTSYNFVKIDTRKFKTIYVDALNCDPFAKAVEAIEKENLDDAIVKMKVKLSSADILQLNELELYKILKDRSYFVAGIEKEIVKDSSHLRHPGLNERLNPKDALTEYISKKEDFKSLREQLLYENALLLEEVSREMNV